MGEFLIECTLCGVSFGSEKLYDNHPCMEDDVKVPFKIKMEQDDEETELEEEVQKAIDQAANSCKVEPLTTVKEEPLDVDFEDIDPLGISQEDEGGHFSSDAGIATSSLEPVNSKDDADDPAEDPNGPENEKGATLNECFVCGKRFFRREDFLNHRMNAHKVPRPYECQVCQKKFTQKHYVALHMRVHTGERPYKCKLCSNTYTHKTSFTIHMRIHNGDRPYRCLMCGKRCYDKSGLTSHMRSHTKETPYECEMCGRRFTHSKSLLVHRRNHTGEKPYVCKYCGKSFRHWHKHKIHIRLHTGERPYRCKVCGKGFPRNDEVKRHMRSHQGIKAFKCSICSVYCATQASITGHIDLHHSDLKPDNPSAPEKTVVRSSVCGILGTKAPQPRTIYKPIAPLPDSESTTSEGKGQPKIILAGKKGSDGKTKALSYKEYMELQEKLLADKGLVVKNPIGTSAPSESAKNKSTGASTSKKTDSAPQTISSSNGKQIMILSAPNVQPGGAGGGGVFLLPNHSVGNTPPVQTVTSTVPNNPGPQLVLGTPSVVLPQQQQFILLSPTGQPQNALGTSPPMFLLANPGGNNQRLLLLPKQTTAPGTNGNQMVLLANSASGVATTPLSNVAIKQEVLEGDNVAQEKVLATHIKQEPGVEPSPSIVIKQEPEENNSMVSSNLCKVVIKQEPPDTE